jgi:hypothetical protein
MPHRQWVTRHANQRLEIILASRPVNAMEMGTRQSWAKSIRTIKLSRLGSTAMHKDHHIRNALHSKKLSHLKQCRDTLVIDELGLSHARSRIDIAVLNGTLHGYEIKSEADNLDRFELQLQTYSQALGRLTFVCATKHVHTVLDHAPNWCGVMEARRGARGAVLFSTLRRASSNPHLDREVLARLLWRDEAVKLLLTKGIPASDLRGPRRELYTLISDLCSKNEILSEIKMAMRQRENWRDRPVRLSYDDLSPHVSSA